MGRVLLSLGIAAGLFLIIMAVYALPLITVSAPGNATLNDSTPALNFTTDEPSNITYDWDSEGNISGCKTCTSYNASYGETVVDTNIVLLLHFNENSGSVVYDDSSYGNNGTLGNSSIGDTYEPAWVNGKFGGGLNFSCTDCSSNKVNYIEVPHSPSLNLTKNLTILAWIKNNNPEDGNYHPIVEKFDDDYDVYVWNGYLYVYVETAGPPWVIDFPGSTKLSDPDAWYCVAMNYDGSAVKLYLNGQEEGSASLTADLDSSTGSLVIGGNSGDGSFNGIIDEIAIYNRALTQPEIAAFCNKTLSDGPHNVTVYAKNQTGSSASTTYFTVDTVAPSLVQLSAPANGSYTVSTVEFNWTASDATSNMSSNLTINGTVVNASVDTNSGAPTFITVSGLSEGAHNWSITTWDAAGNANSSQTWTFTVDVTAPTYSIYNNTPLSPQDNENVTCYSKWNDTSLAFAVIEVIAPGFIYNETVNLTNASGWGNYTISAGDLEAGSVQCTFFANDSAGNINATPALTFSVSDTSAPLISDISYVPNLSADLDPGVAINVSANVVDYTGLDTVLLQYRNDSGSWSSANMSNVSGVHNASFTPPTAGNWSFRVWANDTTYGNTNTSSTTTVEVAYDWGWTSSPTSFGAKSGGIGSNISIGDLNITSQSDYNLSFDLSSSSSWIYFNTSAGSASYDVNAGESRIIAVNASLPAPTPAEYSVVITIDAANASATPSSRTANVTVIAYQDGPYLYVTIDLYPIAVTQGDTNVSLIANVTNQGNGTANNVTLGWIFPSGWSNASGPINVSRSALLVGNKNSLKSILNVSISDSAPTGTQTLQAMANSEEDGPNSRSVSVYVAAKSTTTTVGIGGGGSPRVTKLSIPSEYSPTSAQRRKILNVGETFELVRGRNSSFEVSVTNPFENSTIEDLGLEVSGPFAQYLTVRDRGKTGPEGAIKIKLASGTEGGLKYNETRAYEVTADTPSYIEKGTYPVNLTITGDVSYKEYPTSMYEATGKVLDYKNITYELAESTTVELDVHIISRSEGDALVEGGATDIGYMQNAGFSIKRVDRLLEAARKAMADGDYETAGKISEEISRIKEAAFSARDAIGELQNIIKDAEEAKGLKVPETKNLLGLAVAAFEREDYETSLQRVNDAQLVYSSETRGKVNYAKMLLDNLLALIVVAGALLAVAIVSFNKINALIVARRLEGLDIEEINIMGLMREVQDNYYIKKSLGLAAYEQAMDEYTKRLTEIKGEKAKLKAKRAAMVRPSEELKSLKEESHNLEELMRDAQDRYYNRKAMTKREYNESMEYYMAVLTDVEEAIAVLEIKVSK